MQYIDLIARLNNLTDSEEVAFCFKALHQDQLVWEGFKRISEDTPRIESIAGQKQKLNAGTLGLIAFDPEFDFSNLPPRKLPREMLEKVMLGYEDYLQADETVDTLEDAAMMALALIEKRQASENWKSIFQEIFSRMKISTRERFEQYWSSILVITLNLVEDKDELLRDLSVFQQPEMILGAFIHLVLCLPEPDDRKTELLRRYLYPLSAQVQALALKELKQSSGPELAGSVAGRILEKYRNIDLGKKATVEYWKNPIPSVHFAFQCQAVADIAQYAGESRTAVGLNDKALEVLSALVKMNKVKKAGIVKDTESASELSTLFSSDELDDPQIQSELIYSGSDVDLSTEHINYPVKVMRQSKRMISAGNSDLAREELRESLKNLSENDLERIFVEGPDQIQTWDPVEFLTTLVDVQAYEEAGQLAGILLRQNPSSLPVNLAAAKAADGRGDFDSSLSNWETLVVLQPKSKEIKRNLAKAYIETGAPATAYEMYKDIVQVPESAEDADLVCLGEIALKIDQPQEALDAATQLLMRNPEHSSALTIAGIAQRRMGQTEMAIESLNKAIEASGGDARPWIELGDIQWSGGDHDLALTTLKEGIAANPGKRELQSVYAEKLMQEGLISEAYPLLRDLSGNGKDQKIDLLLIDAMEHLGTEDIDEVLETLSNRYPEESRFLAEYGQRLVWKGNTEKGLTLLKQIGEELAGNTDWSLAYAEAVLKPDYITLSAREKITKTDGEYTRGLVNNILTTDPDNAQARLLKAESLLASGEYSSAHRLFSELLDENAKDNKSLQPARVYAGLAEAAARSGHIEIAQAALDQAIEMEPGWFGLQRVKAEIYTLAGDDAAAVKQVHSTLEMVPEQSENHFWAAGYLREINKTEEAEKILTGAVERFPEHLGLRLLQAESTIASGNISLDHESEGKILSLIEETENINDLIKAAVVFARLENQEKTVYCLEKATGLGSLDAALYLAGLYRIRKDNEHSKHVLDQIQSGEVFTNLLKAEILFDQGKGDLLSILDTDSSYILPDINFEELFLPATWKEILSSSKPDICLRTKVAMRSGNPGELLDRVREWVSSQPENLEARVYATEVALACSSHEDYSRFVDYQPGEAADSFGPQFDLLRQEYQQDSGRYSLEDAADPELYEIVNADEPDKLARIREMVSDGNFAEAETTFEMAMSVFSNLEETPYVNRLGILRNLIKSAVVLERWSDAFQLCEFAVKLAPVNDGLQVINLKTRAMGFENRNRAVDLEVEKHVILDGEIDHYAAVPEEGQIQISESQQDEVRHWILRLKLALDASKENIRNLALLTPHPEDAAAMMAGLRQVDQVNTAIQVGRKFEEHPLVLYELALCVGEKNPRKAADFLGRSLAGHPNQPLTLRLRSKLLEKAGLTADAVANLEDALALWQNEPRWHLEAAALWKQMGNMEKPLEHLQLANIYSPGNGEIQRSLGEAYLNTNKPAEALTHLLAAVEKEPDQYETWGAISEAYQLTGDLDLALNAAEKAVQLDPTAVKAHLQAGKVSWTKGDIEKALDQVNLAISLDPDDADNYVFMARLFTDQGNNGKALEMLEKASQSKNATVHTMIEHANLLKLINGSAAARDLIESFSQKFPENPELLILLAEAEDQCGDLKKAEVVAKKALEIHPEETDLHMLLGKIQEKNGNLDQAAHYFSQAIALDASMIEGYLNLSQIFIMQREYGKAKNVLEQGIEKIPGDIRLYLACANLLKEAKDYQGAEYMLRKASSLDPRNVNIHRQLGAVLALNMVHQSQEVSSQI